ncbi:MAG: hypothetical protein IPG77_19290 [Betaproteobacteria bacterium]|nr:hypothetical protein [Betaproteobacteria bacterium]
MQPMVAELQPADFPALGAYFQKQPTSTHPVADPELAQVGRFIFLRGNTDPGVPARASCHGETGQGTPRCRLPRSGWLCDARWHGTPAPVVREGRAHQRQRRHAHRGRQADGIKMIKAVASYVSGLQMRRRCPWRADRAAP